MAEWLQAAVREAATAVDAHATASCGYGRAERWFGQARVKVVKRTGRLGFFANYVPMTARQLIALDAARVS